MYMKEVLKFDVKQVHACAAALRLCDVSALEKLLTYFSILALRVPLLFLLQYSPPSAAHHAKPYAMPGFHMP